MTHVQPRGTRQGDNIRGTRLLWFKAAVVDLDHRHEQE